jgi:FHS family Na+ dependent glucose MFS transporter 1
MPNAVRKSVGYFLLFICLGLDMAVIGPALPSLAAQTGSTLGAIGLLFFLSALGAALGTLLGGWIFDAVPGRFVLASAQLLSGTLMFLTPHVPWYFLLIGLSILKGGTGGLVNTGANTLMLWTHGKKAGPFITALHFFFGLGAFLGPFLFGLMMDAGGRYASTFHLLAAVDLLVGLFVLAFLRPPAPQRKAAQGTGASADGGRLLAPLVLSAMLFLFFYVSAEITFGGWIYTYAVTLNLVDAVRAAYLTSAFWLAFTVGRLISIPIATRVQARWIIPAALAGCAVFLAAIPLLPDSPSAVWVAVAGAGFCMAPVWPSGFTLAGQSVPLTARLSGFILLGDSIGGMILPGLTGWIMERAGAPAMPQLVLASVAATFLAFLGILVFGKAIRAEKDPA